MMISSVMLDYIDPRISVPLTILLWVAVLVLFLVWPFLKEPVNEFFAVRRHKRRERNRAEQARHAAMLEYMKNDAILTNRMMASAKTPHHARH